MWEFLDLVFLNNTVKDWLLSAAFMAGGLVAGNICSLVMAALLKHWCSKTKYKIDDIIIAALGRPLSALVFWEGLYLGFDLLHLSEDADLWINRALDIFFAVIFAWGINRVIDAVIEEYVPAKVSGTGKQEAALQPVLRKVCKALVWLVTGALILKTLGHNVSALMAGLGLGGAAIALASKDTLANFFGSITVFVDRPFRLHDRIRITGYDGVITDMGIRTSRLRTSENRTVFIPNSVFAANPIENISAEPHTKVSQTINIKRDAGIEKITLGLSLIMEIGAGMEGTCGAPSAGIVSFNGAACQVSFIYYVAKNADYLATVNRVNLELLRRFEEAGILLG